MNDKVTAKEMGEAEVELEKCIMRSPVSHEAHERFHEKTGMAIHEITYTFLEVTQLKDLPIRKSVPGLISVRYLGGYL